MGKLIDEYDDYDGFEDEKLEENEICPECGSKNIWVQSRSIGITHSMSIDPPEVEWRSGCRDCDWEGEFPDEAKAKGE